MNPKKPNNLIDLAWGHPEFLRDYWKDKPISIDSYPYDNKYWEHPLPELTFLIKQLHKKHGNCDTTNKHLVIGHGATQLLLGLLTLSIKENVLALVPHFSRFLHLANLARLSLNSTSYKAKNSLQILTVPNNPDGSLGVEKCDDIIYDASYNWETYHSPIKLNVDVALFSLSKATGHAGTRIGWAVIKDERVANLLREYVEFSSSGVAIESQLKAIEVIKYELQYGDVFSYGKEVLNNRWKKLRSLKLPFNVLNENGQFAWCHGDKHPRMYVVNGKDCGMADPKYFRINMGCSEEAFEQFIKLYDKRRV